MQVKVCNRKFAGKDQLTLLKEINDCSQKETIFKISADKINFIQKSVKTFDTLCVIIIVLYMYALTKQNVHDKVYQYLKHIAQNSVDVRFCF